MRQWQGVKAAALGKGHEVHRLGEVLDGRMLQQWRARAIDMKQQAVHWDYRIGRVVIDSGELRALSLLPCPVLPSFAALATPALGQVWDRGSGAQGPEDHRTPQQYEKRGDYLLFS